MKHLVARVAWALLFVAVLAGCASVEPAKLLAPSQQDLAPFSRVPLQLATTAEQVAQRSSAAQRLLEQPLHQMLSAQAQQKNAQAQATRVEFFTVAREAGDGQGQESTF